MSANEKNMSSTLTDKSSNKFLLLFMVYATQFMPIGFFFAAIPVILRTQGWSLTDLSYIYAMGLFWALKFLWAPLSIIGLSFWTDFRGTIKCG